MNERNKAQRITGDALAEVAAQGVRRALQARESAAKTALTPEELALVGGGGLQAVSLSDMSLQGSFKLRVWAGGIWDPDNPLNPFNAGGGLDLGGRF